MRSGGRDPGIGAYALHMQLRHFRGL